MWQGKRPRLARGPSHGRTGGQSSFYRKIYRRGGRSQSSRPRQKHERTQRRGEGVSPPVPLTPTGLVLPRLGPVPIAYGLETHLKETAQLAHTLVRGEVLPWCAYKKDQTLLEFLQAAFDLWFAELGLHETPLRTLLRIADEAPNMVEGVYFTVNLQPLYLDLGVLLQKLDALDPVLAPALVEAMRETTQKIVPVFEGICCRDTVEWLIWGGDEDELLERARDELAQARGTPPGTLSTEDIFAFAESHFLTSSHLDARLEPRFQQPRTLPLDTLQARFVGHHMDKLVQLCDVLKQLNALELPLNDPEVFYDRGDFNPYGLVLGLPRPGADDLVSEIFGELEQQVWNGGEWAPSYVFAVNLKDEASLEQLAASLEAVLQGLATKIVNILVEEAA
jgi:hypothetical protein